MTLQLRNTQQLMTNEILTHTDDIQSVVTSRTRRTLAIFTTPIFGADRNVSGTERRECLDARWSTFDPGTASCRSHRRRHSRLVFDREWSRCSFVDRRRGIGPGWTAIASVVISGFVAQFYPLNNGAMNGHASPISGTHADTQTRGRNRS